MRDLPLGWLSLPPPAKGPWESCNWADTTSQKEKHRPYNGNGDLRPMQNAIRKPQMKTEILTKGERHRFGNEKIANLEKKASVLILNIGIYAEK